MALRLPAGATARAWPLQIEKIVLVCQEIGLSYGIANPF